MNVPGEAAGRVNPIVPGGAPTDGVQQGSPGAYGGAAPDTDFDGATFGTAASDSSTWRRSVRAVDANSSRGPAEPKPGVEYIGA